MSPWGMPIATEMPQFLPWVRIPERLTALCYGHNTMLLLTRQRMLIMLGCSCDTVMSDADYEARLWSAPPSLIVLCQSLTGEECGYASRFAAEHSPQSRLVVMFTRMDKCVPNKAHVMLSSSDAPRAFMRPCQTYSKDRHSRQAVEV